MSAHRHCGTEFPDFTLDVPVPSDWIDVSWHNDACPAFRVAGYELGVWIDYADPAMREYPDADRFALFQTDSNGAWQADIFSTNDWAEMISHIEALTGGL